MPNTVFNTYLQIYKTYPAKSQKRHDGGSPNGGWGPVQVSKGIMQVESVVW